MLSHLDLDDLIADVAREIHIFSVWLQSVWYWAIIERTRSQPVVQRSFCLTLCVSATLYAGESVLLTQTLQTRQPTLTHVQTICFSGNATRYYTYLHLTLRICAPYTAHLWQPYTGCIVLAHTSSTLFSEENCQLLQHLPIASLLPLAMPMPGAA